MSVNLLPPEYRSPRPSPGNRLPSIKWIRFHLFVPIAVPGFVLRYVFAIWKDINK